MRQLSALDTAFLCLETPSTPMHTMGVLVLESSAVPISTETIQALLVERMHMLPSLGQRLVEWPLLLDRPVLVDDPEFDVRNHVVQWNPAGTLFDLDHAVGALASHPLDRHRPLWEAWVFDRLREGGSAVVFKVHHAIADGESAALFLAQLLDTEPNRPAPRTGSRLRLVRKGPGAPALLSRAIAHQAQQPLQLARTAVRATRGAGALWSKHWKEGAANNSWPLPLSPSTGFDGGLTAERQVARGSAPLDDFRFIKKAFDTTVNDVLLAALTLALRRHLEERGMLPRRPLVAAVPVSNRDGNSEVGGNCVSNMFVRLPVQLEHPEDVMRRVRREALEAKRVHELLISKVVGPGLEALPPVLLRWIARQHERLGLANFHPPACNIIVSNITGPPSRLYCAGVPVRSAHPFGPLMDGTALNLTVLSYRGRMDFGLIACPTRMPDAIGLVEEIESAVARLRDAAEHLGHRERGAADFRLRSA